MPLTPYGDKEYDLLLKLVSAATAVCDEFARDKGPSTELMVALDVAVHAHWKHQRVDAETRPIESAGSTKEDLQNFVVDFMTKQEPLGADFAKVLSDNIWELYSRDNAETRTRVEGECQPPAVFADPENVDCVTCYEQDEAKCFDGMCLRTGCRKRNERLASPTAVRDEREELIEQCAKIAERDTRSDLAKAHNYEPDFYRHAKHIAKSIRALLTTRAVGGESIQKETPLTKHKSTQNI